MNEEERKQLTEQAINDVFQFSIKKAQGIYTDDFPRLLLEIISSTLVSALLVINYASEIYGNKSGAQKLRDETLEIIASKTIFKIKEGE